MENRKQVKFKDLEKGKVYFFKGEKDSVYHHFLEFGNRNYYMSSVENGYSKARIGNVLDQSSYYYYWESTPEEETWYKECIKQGSIIDFDSIKIDEVINNYSIY